MSNQTPQSQVPDHSGIDMEKLLEAVIVAVLAAAMFAYTFTFEKVPAILAQGIGPAIFPRAILTVMFLLACVLAYQAVRPSAAELAKRKPYKPIPAIAYVTGGMMLLFVIGLYTVGTLVSIPLFTFGLALLWGERRHILSAVIFALFTLAVFLLFQVTLGIILP